ncbi:MAG: hypothetical protein IKM55_00665 [Bacilli bacterium]|nr:hypothetical protein [Bacilli bacterium]
MEYFWFKMILFVFAFLFLVYMFVKIKRMAKDHIVKVEQRKQMIREMTEELKNKDDSI